ncbi:MAG: hypothetical protein WC658_03620, partial [Candidatus Omnitrophota bacterium]
QARRYAIGEERKIIGEGEYALNFSDLGASEINLPGGASQDLLLTACAHRSGLKFMGDYAGHRIVKFALSGLPETIGIEFLERPEFFMDTIAGRIGFDVGVARALGLRIGEEGELEGAKDLVLGFACLFALGQLHEFYHLKGLDESPALHKLLDFYEVIAKKNPVAVLALHKLLATPYLDSDNIFSIFLQDATAPAKTKDKHKKVIWRERRIAWMLGKQLIDLPVDLPEVREILDSRASKDLQSQMLLDEAEGPFSRKAYGSRTERANTRRLRDKMLEEGRSLTVSRYGRASYFLVMLASASKFLLALQEIENICRNLTESATKGVRPLLGKKAPDPFLLVQEAATMHVGHSLEEILGLSVSADNVSKADMQGAIKRLEDAIDAFRDEAGRRVTQFAREKGLSGRAQKQARERIHQAEALMREGAQRLKEAVDESPVEAANFSVLIQRASATGIRALSNMLDGRDPFEGDEPHIAKILSEAGDNVYASPDDAWFEVAQYWIEALPLYIHEEKTRLASGKIVTRIVIEQEIFEAALRKLAPRWKANIDDCMDSEHIAIARHIIVEAVPSLRSRKQELMTDGALSEEEAELLAVREVIDRERRSGESKLEQQVAEMAAVVELTWRNLRDKVAQRQVKKRQECLRYDALCEVIDRDTSAGNLVAQVQTIAGKRGVAAALNTVISREERALRKAGLTTFSLNRKIEALEKNNMPYLKRREIPTWIILTTQAAGMSDLCSGYWVDEEMALFSATQDLMYQGKSLEEEAQELANSYKGNIITAGRWLVQQFSLEDELEEMLAEANLENTPENRDRMILRLVTSYRDLAQEAAKVCLLNEVLPPQERDYSREYPVVTEYLGAHRLELEQQALERVVRENEELYLTVNVGHKTLSEIACDAVYQPEIDKYMLAFARDAVIAAHPFAEFIQWYAYPHGDSMPRFIRYRLETPITKGITTARQEVLASYWRYADGTLEKVENWEEFTRNRDKKRGGMPLMLLLNDPLYSYTASGRNKKYNRGYGPSRVDLGTKERKSVEEWAQWVSPVDSFAEEAMVKFYRLYNFDVRAFKRVQHGETAKPLENGFMEASLAVTHIFQSLMQAIGIGNFNRLASETNQRMETFIRAGGAGSSGFCQPKDIYFLIFVNSITRDEVMLFAGQPINSWKAIQDLAVKVRRRLGSAARLDDKAQAVFAREIEKYFKEHSGGESHSTLIDPRTFIPQMSFFAAQGNIGIRDFRSDPWGFLRTLIAAWQGEALAVLEGRIRFVPASLAMQLRWGIEKIRERSGGETASWRESVIPIPTEYKPVSDPRLAAGLKLLEFLCGTSEHLSATFGDEGEALARLVVHGFNRHDEAMVAMLKEKAGISEEDFEALEEAFSACGSPADVRMYSPCNLSSIAIYDYVSGNRLRAHAEEARKILREETGLNDATITAALLTPEYKTLRDWPVIRNLPEEKYRALERRIGERIHILRNDARLNDDEYRSGPGTDVWEAHR